MCSNIIYKLSNFLLVYLFYILKSITINNYKNNKIIFHNVCSLLILLRGEFILFYIFTLIYFLSSIKKFKINFYFLNTVSLVISPYLIRNYINFDSFVITKSFGYNLLKGNNPEFKVEGNYEYIEKEYVEKILK